MSKHIWFAAAVLLMLTSCPGGGSGSGSASNKAPSPSKANQKPAVEPTSKTPPVKTADAGPVDRGYDIFHTTEYSNTSLVCANCHADSERISAERVFIASSGHGSASRGAWKITSQAMLDAGEGRAKTLIDAANICVKAPYLNHAEKLIEGSDAEALVAYLDSIATDDEAFMISRAKMMPVGGLLFDEENGTRIYATGCQNCHDSGLENVPELAGASEWLNALQVMAKVRKIGDDYYGDWEGMAYGDYAKGEAVALAGQANPCGDNPCGDNPCGDGHDHDAHGDDHGDDHDDSNQRMFAPGAMPFYGTNVLSDQDVVDVAYFVSTIL